MRLTHLDLFSGIGGFALAAARAGFRTVGFSEVEPYACRVLAERFPGIPNLGDVRERGRFAGVGPVTVLTAGYPCQPASLAGKRRGKADDRWLWPAACGIVEVVRPAWFIGENVFGHVSMGLDDVLADLESLGYSAQSFIVPACAVGAWHLRGRVWIIAYADGGRELQPCRHLAESGRRAIYSAQATDADSCSGGPQGRQLHAENQTGRTESEDVFEWPAEPPLVRVVHGIPNRAHRIKGLGNAIVPQVAERFFRWIAQIENQARGCDA